MSVNYMPSLGQQLSKSYPNCLLLYDVDAIISSIVFNWKIAVLLLISIIIFLYKNIFITK